MEDLQAHAERMRRTGATVDEAERRYVVPKRFEDYRIAAWDYTVGAALRSFWSRL